MCWVAHADWFMLGGTCLLAQARWLLGISERSGQLANRLCVYFVARHLMGMACMAIINQHHACKLCMVPRAWDVTTCASRQKSISILSDCDYGPKLKVEGEATAEIWVRPTLFCLPFRCGSGLEELDLSLCTHLGLTTGCQIVRSCRQLRVLTARWVRRSLGLCCQLCCTLG